MSPVVLVADDRHATALLERLSPARRAAVTTATPAEAAERLQPYLDFGFGGFVFRNQTMITPDEIALGGELIALLRGPDAEDTPIAGRSGA
jgi:hypothetical protein